MSIFSDNRQHFFSAVSESNVPVQGTNPRHLKDLETFIFHYVGTDGTGTYCTQQIHHLTSKENQYSLPGPAFACVPNELRPHRTFSGWVHSSSRRVYERAAMQGHQLQVRACVSVYVRVHVSPSSCVLMYTCAQLHAIACMPVRARVGACQSVTYSCDVDHLYPL